jgi:hypothetical protein
MDVQQLKGFTMQDYYRDDWNDADQCPVVDYSKVNSLENEVMLLREQVQDKETDELYILYQLMDIQETLDPRSRAYEELGDLIAIHSPELREKAKHYTNKLT